MTMSLTTISTPEDIITGIVIFTTEGYINNNNTNNSYDVFDTTTMHSSSQDGSSEGEAIAEAKELFKRFIMFGFLPISVIGLFLNAISIWVWNANKKHNPMVLLFQILGVTDMIYLGLSVIRGALYCVDGLPPDKVPYMLPALYLSQSMSLHCTVVIGVIRWLAIAWPHRMKHVTRRHLLAICGVVGCWVLLMGLMVVVMVCVFNARETEYWIMDGVLEVVMFVLPTLTLVGFSISLLFTTFLQRHRQIMKKRKRTTMAVLSIASCAVVTFILGMLGLFFGAMFPDRSDDGCNWSCVFSSFAIGLIIFVFNSSINFVFYFFFASKFRGYLNQSLNRCWHRVRGRHGDFTPAAHADTTDSAEGALSSSSSPAQGHRMKQLRAVDDKDDSSEDLHEKGLEMVEGSSRNGGVGDEAPVAVNADAHKPTIKT